MEDLISRDKLVQKIKDAQDSLMSNDDKTWEMNKNYFKGLSWAHRMTLDAPAEDAELVRHGRWIMRGGQARCSVCDAKAKWDCSGGTGGWSHEYEQAKTPFCWNCGARMDGDDTDVRPPENGR